MVVREPSTCSSDARMSTETDRSTSIAGPPEIEPQEVKKLIEQRRGLVAAFAFAFNGLLRTLCTQRNMKIHWLSGLAVMLVGMALELDIASRASVIFCVAVVLCMEALNSALEAFVDLHVRQYARTAMIAKDAAAAAVLVLAIGAVVVFSDILFHRWRMVLNSGPAIARTVAAGVPLLLATGLGLWLKRSVALLVILGAIAVGLVTFLAYYSRDEVFSLGALAFILGAFTARFREPRLISRP
jgi:diacylglycerol kinase (ATP)